MSKYTSKNYDTPKSYDTSIGSYGYVSRSHGLGDSSQYGSATGRNYMGTSYDMSSGTHGGSTYDGRSFGTDENIRVRHGDSGHDRYRETTYRTDLPYEHSRLYTPSKLEDYVTETHQASPRSNWRDAYSEKYGKHSELSHENQDIHRPYQFKNGNNEHKDEHVSSDLEEPSSHSSYYSRYRERHKKDKEASKTDVKLDESSAKRSDLTPSEKLALIRQRIRKRDENELERPLSADLSQESTPRSVLSPVSKTYDENTEHIPKWRQRKVLEDVTKSDSNKSSLAKHHSKDLKDGDKKSMKTEIDQDKKLDDVFSQEIPSSSPLAEWRKKRQDWEHTAVKKNEGKLEADKQEGKIDTEIKIPRPTRHEYNQESKVFHGRKELSNDKHTKTTRHDEAQSSQIHDTEQSKTREHGSETFSQDKHSSSSSTPAHSLDVMSHIHDIGDLKTKADAVKNILRQRDSPILRSRYNEVCRRRELSKDSSKDEGSETNSRTSSVDLGSSRPTSSDFSDSSRPSSFIFGTDFVSHHEATDLQKAPVRSRSNIKHLKESVQMSDDSGFVDSAKEIQKNETISKESRSKTAESPQEIHEKLRSRRDKKETTEKVLETRQDKIQTLLYGKPEAKTQSDRDSKILTKTKTFSKESHRKTSENEDKVFTRTKTSTKEKEEHTVKKVDKSDNQHDSKYSRGRTHVHTSIDDIPSQSSRHFSDVKSKNTVERPKSVTDIYKPEIKAAEERPKSAAIFGQVFTVSSDTKKPQSKEDKLSETKQVLKTSESSSIKAKDTSDQNDEKSIETKIAEQRKKLQGLYKKAQTTDIASILSREEDSESEETSTASSISIAESEAEKKSSTPITFAELSKLSRVERIAKYKEERRKQLAYIANRFGEKSSDKEKGDVVPSLFLSARQFDDEKASVSRSQSVKIDSSPKSVTPVTRSKSLHGDTDSPRSKGAVKVDIEKSKTGTPKQEVKSPREKYYETLSKRDHKLSIGDSDEDDTIEQINARTREALSSMIKQDAKTSSVSIDKKSKVKSSEVKEEETTSDSHAKNETEEEKKGKYMFSMEKMRKKFLFEEDSDKAQSDKISEKKKTEDDSALNKPEKRRRQLPSIPMALGGNPEPTRPKSSIELSSTGDKSDILSKKDLQKLKSEQKEKQVSSKSGDRFGRRQVQSENDVRNVMTTEQEASVLERKGDFVSFQMGTKEPTKAHGKGKDADSKSQKKEESDNKLSAKHLQSVRKSPSPKNVRKRYQRTTQSAFLPPSTSDTKVTSVSDSVPTTAGQKSNTTSATKTVSTSAKKTSTTASSKPSTSSISQSSTSKTAQGTSSTFAVKSSSQVIIAPSAPTVSTTKSDVISTTSALRTTTSCAQVSGSKTTRSPFTKASSKTSTTKLGSNISSNTTEIDNKLPSTTTKLDSKISSASTTEFDNTLSSTTTKLDSKISTASLPKTVTSTKSENIFTGATVSLPKTVTITPAQSSAPVDKSTKISIASSIVSTATATSNVTTVAKNASRNAEVETVFSKTENKSSAQSSTESKVPDASTKSPSSKIVTETKAFPTSSISVPTISTVTTSTTKSIQTQATTKIIDKPTISEISKPSPVLSKISSADSATKTVSTISAVKVSSAVASTSVISASPVTPVKVTSSSSVQSFTPISTFDRTSVSTVSVVTPITMTTQISSAVNVVSSTDTEVSKRVPSASTTLSSASVSPITTPSVKNTADSEHKQIDTKSSLKQGLNANSLSRSKSLTESDSPLRQQSPSHSPRINNVGALADTLNLDDILMENVEYLSDIEICNQDSKQKQGPVAQASNVDHHHKTKRSLRKKVLQRSKSDADKHQREPEESPPEKSSQHTVAMTSEDLTGSRQQTTYFKATETKPLLAKEPDKGELLKQKTVTMVTQSSGQTEIPLTSTKERPKLSQTSTSSFTSSVDLEISPKNKSVETESSKVITESTEKVQASEDTKEERKRRKDKSSKRKSALNQSEGLSGGDKPSISSSLSSESSDHGSSKSPVTNSSSHLSHNSLSQHGTNHNDHSQHASGKSVLDNLLPSKFSFPSKVSSAISKFSHENEAERKEDSHKAPPKITRKNNFSSLLQRFSSPEPQDQVQSSQKQIGLRRQEACAISSASSDDSRRSTPERSQSLRIRRTPPPDDIETTRGVQRSGSFKSDFMRRRYSPEPIERRTLPNIPDKTVTEHVQPENTEQADDMKSSKIYLCTSSDKPTEELAEILKQRKKHVKTQQKDGQQEERERITSKKIEKAENLLPAADVDEVIENPEVLSILKTRRNETDSKIKNGEEKSTLSVSNEHLLVQSTELISEVPSSAQESGVKIVPRIARKSSHEHTKSHITASKMAPSISEDKQSHAKIDRNEVKSDISDIDTSLAVLDVVSQDIDDTAGQSSKRKMSAEDISNMKDALSKVDIESPEQVSAFIKDVRRTSVSKIEADSTPAVQTDVGKNEEKNEEIKSSATNKKVEELRQSPERKSRMSPKLLEKVKATEAKLASLGTVNLKRSESYGHKEGERHKPKGILKRAVSMKKSGVVVDPELATILQRRRSRHEDDSPEIEKGTKVTPSAEEDIQQSLRREQAQRSSSIPHDNDDDEVQMLSITERIFHMENKLEETRSCPITPKSRSGATTPKLSTLYRSGSITSQSLDQDEVPSLTSNRLLQKLNNLAEQKASSSVEEKRRGFQKRPRDDWRTRTQPVTLEELEEAGNLATVQAFRAEVLRKASANVFEQLNKQDKQIVYSKKIEYPQHLPRRRRNRFNRHKTLPVTAAELGSVPEAEELSRMSYRLKTGHSDMRDSKADSGILSGSDLEGYDSARSDSSRSLSLEADLTEDDPARLSVSAKASMFKNISEEKAKKSASGARRYIDRKKRERSRTLPVTDDEVHSAAEIADGDGEKIETENKALEVDEKEGIHDELSKRSLAEKVQLFQNLKQEEEKAASKPNVPPPVARRRKGRLASRFSTQPVTVEEVEKAAKISPLAMSLVKPPDPEILKGLPLSAQRDIMAKHAEASLSQPGSRSSSRHGSMGDLSDESKKGILKSMEKVSLESTEVHGILKHEQAKSPERDVKSILKPDHPHVSDTEQRSILKHSEESVLSKAKHLEQKGILKHEEEIKELDKKAGKAILKHDEKSHDLDKKQVKPILKHEEEKCSEHDKKSIKPILKHEDEETRQRHESGGSVKAILRKAESLERKAKSEEVKPILKHHDASDDPVKSKDFEKKRKSLEEELHFTPILKHTEASKDFEKKRKSLEEELHFTPILKHPETKEADKTTDVKGVLKKEKSIESVHEPKGILKKESSFETKVTEPEKSSMKKSPSRELKEQKLHGILHKSPHDDETHVDEITEVEIIDVPSEVIEDTGSAAQKRRGRDPAERERYLTQPADATPEKSPETPRKFKYTGRHKTQPITPEEKRDAEIDATVTRSGSLRDRLDLLKQSGEEDWKKRVQKNLDLEPGSSPMEVKLREKVGGSVPRPSSIADRLNLLNTAQAGWKERVEETDAKQFTVAHKLAGQVEDSPLMRKLKGRAKKDPTVTITSKEPSPPPEKIEEPEEAKGPVKVTVPDINDESIRSFFHSREITELSSQKVDVSIDDFNELFILANDMLPSIHRIRPKRKHQGSMKNPLKSIHTTIEIKAEYEEVSSGVAEKEVKRIKTEQISRGAGFAQAALAGLASREDFSSVNLRRTDSMKGLNTIDPYKDLMLLHVKGRRRTQVRLVEPVASSVNSGDCYVLVTPEKIIQWIGEYANVIEKAKAADVATFIQQKKDLGCKSPTTVAVVEEKKQYMGAGKLFWSALGGQGTVCSAGPPEEDELYENHIVETNMVYRLEGNALVPCKEYWGNVPKIEMLKKDEVIVFDFGSELYVWQGKAVKPDQRKLGVKLARKLWENGYDYSAALINPLCPLKTEECGGLSMSGSKRPDWALFGKVNQNMETILFREKFADWPDNSRLIKVKGQDEMSGSKVDLADLKPFDANLMLRLNTGPVSLVLEGSHVGRGTEWDEDMDGFIRKQSIVTLGVKVWHVLEYDHFALEENSYGQFHDGDTYVVRWQYMITNKDSKDLKGSQSRRSLVGRERCAYFFWQGKNSTINEKGASALMTVELDEERGPQVRVDEGKEIPCFLNLFNGRTIIHIGKREEESTNTQGPWKCYCVRNVLENETCLIEVTAEISSLRSRSSFLLLNIHTGKLYIWHGCLSPKYTQKLALAAAEKLQNSCPLEVGVNKQASIAVTELHEGKETLDFWRMMGVSRNDRSLYSSLLLSESKETQSIRLFHMTSVSGTFDVQEILNPTRVPDLVSPFPVLQSDLYRTSQPELFLLDSGDKVYLWHGWWPEGNSEVENVQTGSAQAKYNVDRQCAIQTAIEYCKLKYGDKIKPVAIYAGLEPLEFTNLFPYWDVNTTARELNLKDGKKDNETTDLEEILQKMMQTRYTFEELQERPLPEGVDASRLESYLDDDEFEEYLQMTKDEFYALPAWKQHALKKDAGLF